MSDDGEKRKDAGDTVREGVRSVIGILGALKDAIEESFEDLRGSAEEPAANEPEAAAESAAEGVRSTFQAAQDAVEDVRGRLDFVTRKEFDALASELAQLRARVDAAHATPTASPGRETEAPDPAEPAPADPTKADGVDGADSSGNGRDYRFEVE